MSAIGTGYDLTASTFSPDGRLFQNEYAQKAVDVGSTMIALRGKTGVLIAVEKMTPSKLCASGFCPRIANANANIGLGLAGVYPDCCAVKNFAIEEATNYLKNNREPMFIEKMVTNIGEYCHIFSLGINRPFGVSTFLASWDKNQGGRLFLIDPIGTYYEYRAWAVGKHRQAAKAEIEKLKLDTLDLKELAKEAARIIMVVRDENREKAHEFEMGWVGEETQGKYETVPDEVVEEAEKWAKEKIEEDEED